MKNNTLIILVAFSAFACEVDPEASPGSWNQLKNFPGEGRNSAISFSILGKGYWGLGGNTTNIHLRDIWEYDPIDDSWVQKNDFPFDLPGIAAATANDKGYVVTYSGGLYEFDPVADTWKYLSSFPGGSRQGIVGFGLGKAVYFGTGNSVVTDADDLFLTFKDFWKYDLSENKWIAIADFPGVSRSEAVSLVIGEKAYVGLGYNGVAAPPIFSDMWSYDATTASWTQIADFPETNSLVGIVFSGATKGYVGVPENVGAHRGVVYEYNPAGDAWRKVSVFPSGNSLETQSFLLNNRSFIVGGWWSQITSQVWEFVP